MTIDMHLKPSQGENAKREDTEGFTEYIEGELEGIKFKYIYNHTSFFLSAI